MNDAKKRQFEMKVLSESIFKNKKKNYRESVGPWFVKDRVPSQHSAAVQAFATTQMENESLKVNMNYRISKDG